MEDNKIIITGEDGETKEFFVEEETRLNNTSYLLVCDSMEEETQAYIMKDVSAPEDIESIYEFVVDDAELKAVAGIFSELLEDEDLI
ncbi:MAG: DUF1292 domain-containing protein [Lachnospiraceae bacterium]|nr:DUF1292 domain-containing protein [Lachnospiraceae bacterium]